ncbi:hypothetical protein EC562_19955 [Vibrio parahaemolyticus]|nr:hypothetical protein [Vibrio parahaemolyticus]EGR2360160.1 hypothetical protein [Vibrio parahaemolyticus]EGR3423121.1 hypothetical protein [Vibrio parahaemolyticus]
MPFCSLECFCFLFPARYSYSAVELSNHTRLENMVTIFLN